MSAYFRKQNPQAPVYVRNGTAKIQFDYLDLSNGYLEAKSDELIGELRKAIKAGVGGMTEITKEEWDSFVQKKSVTPQFRPWREEITKQGLKSVSLPQPVAPPVAPAPAAVVSKPVTPEETAAAAPVVRKALVLE